MELGRATSTTSQIRVSLKRRPPRADQQSVSTVTTQIIGPDGAYVRLGIVCTIAISLLALATPISVQLLINNVANTAMPAPLWALSGVLLMLLLMVAGLSALRVWIMAVFGRRIFARVMAEVTVRVVHAQDPFFADRNRGDLFNR